MAVRACTSHLAAVPGPRPLLQGRPSIVVYGVVVVAVAVVVGVFVVAGRHCGHFVGLRTVDCGLRWPFVCSSLTYCPTALVVTQDTRTPGQLGLPGQPGQRRSSQAGVLIASQAQLTAAYT